MDDDTNQLMPVAFTVSMILLCFLLGGPWGLAAYAAPGLAIGATISYRWAKADAPFTVGSVFLLVLIVVSWPAHLVFSGRK